jgi:hypothetical protein
MQRVIFVLGTGVAMGLAAACGASPTPDTNIFGDDSSSSSSGGGAASTSGNSSSGGSSSGISNGSSGAGNSGTSSGFVQPSSSGSSTGSSSSSGGSSSGTSSGSSSGVSTSVGSSGGTPTMLPQVQGTCPTVAASTTVQQLTYAGEPVSVWAPSPLPSKPGPLVMFWFETGGSANDATWQFGEISEVNAAGGTVVAFGASNMQGTNTGDLVWYTGDFNTADQVVACGIQQHLVDPTRIYALGASAGGLQTTWMSYARSGYLAAVATISGGLTGEDGFYLDPTTMPQDPSNVPAALVNHGAEGLDVVAIDFAVASSAWEQDIAMKHGFSIDCNTGGGHVSGTPQICPGIWQFFQDHPFKVVDDYTSGLPSVFPSDCQIGPRAPDGGAL